MGNPDKNDVIDVLKRHIGLRWSRKREKVERRTFDRNTDFGLFNVGVLRPEEQLIIHGSIRHASLFAKGTVR